MRRKLAVLTLAGFMLYTAIYLFVYLSRAFQISRPSDLQFVGIYHGDNFSRVLLVALLFLIGEVFLLYLALAARRPRRVDVRHDLWGWLKSREELTGEPADVIAERAIAQYRGRLEGAQATAASGSTAVRRPDAR